MLKLLFMLGKKNPSKPILYCSGPRCFLKLQTTSFRLELYMEVWTGVYKSRPSAGRWSVQTKQHISMGLRSLQRKKVPSLCTQKQLCGSVQTVQIQIEFKSWLIWTSRGKAAFYSVFSWKQNRTLTLGRRRDRLLFINFLHIHWICLWEE